MTTVLVLAESPEIEALLADLVVFAGYHPVFLRDDETARDALRSRAIDVLLVDVLHPAAFNGACERAAREAGSAAIVYCTATLSPGELRAFAEGRGACHFALPNGPKLLASVLALALARLGKPARSVAGAPPDAIVTALRAVARAQRLNTAGPSKRDEDRQMGDEREFLLDEARASRDQLHAAVLQYLSGLRQNGLPRDRALDVLNSAMRETAEAAGAPELLASMGRDTEHWVEEAYCAARVRPAEVR